VGPDHLRCESIVNWPLRQQWSRRPGWLRWSVSFPPRVYRMRPIVLRAGSASGKGSVWRADLPPDAVDDPHRLFLADRNELVVSVPPFI
jgi:hypothetical protein